VPVGVEEAALPRYCCWRWRRQRCCRPERWTTKVAAPLLLGEEELVCGELLSSD
jgi:hypothetical protein